LAGGKYALSGGAFLLFIGNLVAIEFASSIVLFFFIYTGKSLKLQSVLQALPRNLFSILTMLVLVLVFSADLRHVVIEETYKVKTRAILAAEVRKVEGDHLADIRHKNTPDALIVRAVVRGPHQLTPEQVAAIQAKMLPTPSGLATDFVCAILKQRSSQVTAYCLPTLRSQASSMARSPQASTERRKSCFSLT
jgi:uncharacterized membrane protein